METGFIVVLGIQVEVSVRGRRQCWKSVVDKLGYRKKRKTGKYMHKTEDENPEGMAKSHAVKWCLFHWPLDS